MKLEGIYGKYDGPQFDSRDRCQAGSACSNDRDAVVREDGMANNEEARYLISASNAKEKAALFQELAGGKSVLRYNDALNAVAVGCGFEEWRELVVILAKLEAGEAYSLNVSPRMLADDLHVDEETLRARRANQVDAVRQFMTCSLARAEELVSRWALTGAASEPERAAVGEPPSATSARMTGVPTHPKAKQSAESSADSGVDSSNDGASEQGTSESSISPSAPVNVSYKRRRVVSPR